MINVKPLIIAGVGIILVAGLVVTAYFKGVSDNKAKMATYASEVAQKVAQEQVLSQKATNNIAYEFQQAVDRGQLKNEEINNLKKRLRAKFVCRNDGAYELWNQSADSINLPKNQRTKEPDGARDGLDIIQYCSGETKRLKLKVTAIQGIIKSRSDCFVQ